MINSAQRRNWYNEFHIASFRRVYFLLHNPSLKKAISSIKSKIHLKFVDSLCLGRTVLWRPESAGQCGCGPCCGVPRLPARSGPCMAKSNCRSRMRSRCRRSSSLSLRSTAPCAITARLGLPAPARRTWAHATISHLACLRPT